MFVLKAFPKALHPGIRPQAHLMWRRTVPRNTCQAGCDPVLIPSKARAISAWLSLSVAGVDGDVRDMFIIA
jgi:hypothetical protein